MQMSRRMVALIAGIVMIILGAGYLIDAIPIHRNIMALIMIAGGVMLVREAR